MDSRPIVVGGCFRSGTSLVRRLLDSHPRIHCGPEVKFFRDFRGDWIEDPIRHVRFMATARSLLSEEAAFEVLGAAFVELHERAARAAGKPRWADKAPENVVFLDDWQRLLGNDWVFVHVVRNPLDTLASIKEAEFPVSIPRDLDGRIELYLRYLQAGLDFAAGHPDRYLRIVYEQLVADPEVTALGLMLTLDEVFDSAQLDLAAHVHQRGLEDPKIARSPAIHRDSVGRWRDLLTAAEVQTIAARTAAAWAAVDPSARWMPRIDAETAHRAPSDRGNT